MKRLLLIVALVGCSTPEPGPEREPCDAGFEDEFTIGTMIVDQSGRSFVPYAEGCNTVEVVTGIQGGWHVEPGIGAPRGESTDTLDGTFSFVVKDGQTILTEEATFRLEPRFWQPTVEGFVYWGDAIVLNAYPEMGPYTLEATIEVDGETVTISADIELVDEEEEGG